MARPLLGEVPALSPKEKARKQLVSRMGVDPDHGWKAKYEILPGKEKVIEELRRLAKDADTIYLATDLDREGEAIAWHLREAIGGDDSRYKRVVFNEITKKAIQEAFSKPGELDIDRVNAQQARRFLDRVVGYMVSPLLWAKIARGLSAGRVQSVAVKLVVEREREIRAFNPEEYWEVHADLGTAKGANVRFEVARENGEAFKPLNEAQAMAAAGEAQGFQLQHRQARRQTDQQQAVGAVHHLHPATGREQPPGLRREENHDDGPASCMKPATSPICVPTRPTCRLTPWRWRVLTSKASSARSTCRKRRTSTAARKAHKRLTKRFVLPTSTPTRASCRAWSVTPSVSTS